MMKAFCQAINKITCVLSSNHKHIIYMFMVPTILAFIFCLVALSINNYHLYWMRLKVII